MSKKLHDKHYDESKKLHTEIKHLLFHETLKTSLGKASVWTPTYVYLDLFAGDGTFKDGSFGSPLIALKEFSRYLTGNSKKLVSVNCALCEKFGKETLERNLQGLQLHPGVSYTVFSDWELAVEELSGIKSLSSYGFIFADQFATELNLQKFIDLVGRDKHEFLIFYNPQALLRLKGRGILSHISLVTGSSIEDVNETPIENFKDFILRTLRKNLRKLRDFVIFAAIPNTRKDKLTWSDYFYLVLGTNDPHVANAFVRAYEKAVEKYRVFYGIYGNLFFESKAKEFEEFILYVVNVFYGRYGRPINLRELYLVATFDLLSWKDAVGYELVVPTVKRVIKALNELQLQGEIKVEAPINSKRKDGLLKVTIPEASRFRKIYLLPA
jgi:three-Cys-motif partner protein